MLQQMMAAGNLLLKPGTLWQQILRSTAQAIERDAIKSIPTEREIVYEYNIPFIVRIASNLDRKSADKEKQINESRQTGLEVNPFLPYEKDLFVADITDSHLCLLNKFNVVDHHLLLVTRDFEEQESLLTLSDFAAMWACMAEFPALAFYNSGAVAGASQRHKHLQLVPLPLGQGKTEIPLEAAFHSLRYKDSIGTAQYLPFCHAIARVDDQWLESPAQAAKATLELYYLMLDVVGLSAQSNHNNRPPSGPYNLLVSRKWMVLVPRTHECFDSISVNSLGFAGSLLVRNDQQLQTLKQHGPMTVLSKVGVTTTGGTL
ncbi:MAG: phosphorylase [Gammaproteobacteria bacterium]|nr:phosphorylase [Gammaproteobacteria bacterium]